MYNPKYIEEFFRRHLDTSNSTTSGDELRTLCPCHKEKNPSFSVNLSTGLYRCFHPDCKLHSGGGIVRFLSVIEDITINEAKELIKEEYTALYPTSEKKKRDTQLKNFPFKQEDIEEYMKALHATPDKVKFLKEKCLWTDETIEKFEIGYDGQAYWIPIKENFQLVNIRKYNPKGKIKVFSQTGFGDARIFPLENLVEQDIFIMEGEKDCILANQLGLNAVTVTGGAGTWVTAWKEHFVAKNVVICYDLDSAGRIGAQKVFNTIGHVARCVKIVELPIEEPANADFTDYILAGNRVQDFHALVQKTEPAIPPSDNPVDIPDEIIDSTLDKISEDLLFYRRNKLNVRVIAVESAPFIIPRCVTVECNKDNGPPCHVCRVGDKEGRDSLVIDETTPRILDLIECSTKDKRLIIRDIFHIPQCRKFRVKEKDHQAINRVSIIPSLDEIDYDDETQNQTYVERELYFIGARLEANTDYEIETLAIPSPKDQSLVHLGYKVKPADSSIEEFRMTPELKEELEIFQCKSETS